MKIITRKEAKSLGLRKFFTGIPCSRGHLSERQIDSYACLQCHEITCRNWVKKNKHRMKAAQERYLSQPWAQEKVRLDRKAYRGRPEIKQRDAKLYQEWYKKNGDAKNARNRSPEKNARRRQRFSERFHGDIQFRIVKNLRTRLFQAIRNNRKAGSAVRDLGCSIAYLKSHLEQQFTRGMSWNNWGPVWHIDHIKPLARFDLTKPEQVQMACHYTNLRPLLSKENISKSAKIIEPFQLPLSFTAAA